MELDLNAPIVPGKSAAGITLGQPLSEFIRKYGELFSFKGNRYCSESVIVSIADDVVSQIGVFDGYRGKIAGKIGIGSTDKEVELFLGVIEENDYDDLVVKGISGFCFEINPDADPQPITEIYIYRPDVL
jgi:hypothetical protein